MKKNLIKTKEKKDLISKIFIFIFSLIGVLALLAMFGAILKEAIPAYKKYKILNMYFSASFQEKDNFGILSALALTLITSIISVMIALPLSLRLAIFMKYKMRNKEKPLKVFINIAAGIPSVIFGIFAIGSLVKLTSIFGFSNANSLFIGILMLVIMIFPTMVSLIYNQLNLVDKNLINAAMALGDSKTSAIYKIVKRNIRPQLYVVVIISLGRAIGETMALSMILTSPSSSEVFSKTLKGFLNSPFATLGVEISRRMFNDGANPDTRSALFAAGIAIFIIIMILISIVTKISNSKSIKIRKPLNFSKIQNWEYPSKHIKSIVIVFHLLIFPFKFIIYQMQQLILAIKIFKRHLLYILMYPINILLYEKRKKGEPYSKYFAKYKREKKSSFLDLWRNVLEIISAFIVVGFIAWIILSILIYGIPNWTMNDWKFQYKNKSGIIVGGAIMNPLIWTILLIMISIIITTPFAICGALYLSEYARNKKSGKIIRFFLDSLGGTPSILFGIFGAIFFLNILKLSSISGGTSLIAGALTITLVILPTFTRSIEQVLIKIPDSMRNASYALGASKFETIKKIVIPQSISGIATGVVLSAGRIISETAPIYLTLGMLNGVELGMLQPGQTLTTSILFNQVFASGNAEVLLNESYKLASVAIILIGFISFITEVISWKPKIVRKKEIKEKKTWTKNKTFSKSIT